ncbi:hypothetical protein L6452_28260 [Arctium lappa]|uniref:Uncharacterized protein n=1 Tax=Arctium lappa TaxID=4217 RepID=A0ACB8ZYY6_ARCLA|nr:hypothetical protein L6452_28260 [Arctium lappa]
MTLMIWINLVMHTLETRQLQICKIQSKGEKGKFCATCWWSKDCFALAEGFGPVAPRPVGLRGLGVKHPLELTLPDQKGYIDTS